jgi:tetratricopeptide (TPR) repeat protein
LPAIAQELAVRYVLEGSVRKAGKNLRITCQLIDAKNDAHLWAEKFSGTMADILDLQETVARSVAQKLSLQLDPREEEMLAERPIPDLRAYESYLRAREGLQTFGAEGIQRALHHLTEALSIAGENAVLLGQLAQVHYQFWNMGIRLDEKDLMKAREYADRALELNPKTPDHHLIRGLLEVTGGSAVKALSYFDAALALDPEYPDALGWYPAIAAFMGLEDAAKERLERLRLVDPLNTFNSFIPIFIHIYKGRFSAALDLAEKTRAARPPEMLVETGYAHALALIGRSQEAVDVIRQTHHPDGGFFAREMLALACALKGDRQGALGFIDGDLERWAEKDFAYSLELGRIFARLGDRKRAIDWLEKGVERGNINHPFLSEYDPSLAALSGHPRYDSLMERVRDEWEAYSSGLA